MPSGIAGRLKSRRVYISGPMSGIPDLNRDAFMDAQAVCADAGAREVFNPQWVAEVHGDKPREVAMAYDIERLARMCCTGECTVVMLPGWERSEGAALEREVALACGAQVVDLPLPGQQQLPMGGE